jgi:hypothetical protein
MVSSPPYALFSCPGAHFGEVEMAEEEQEGTASSFEADDPFGTLAEAGDTEALEGGGATTEDEGPSAAEETLVDPATLPDELKPHWSRMTRAYNKRLSSFRAEERELREKANLVDRFYSDPGYADQVVQDYLARRGGGTPAQKGTPAPQQSAQGVPDSVMQSVRQAMLESGDPNMEFYAPSIAKAAWAVAQQSVQPFQAEQRASRQQASRREYEQMEAALSESAPGWEEYEDEMAARLAFLKNAITGQGPLSDPRYGSLLEMVYDWTTSGKRATAEAGRRMQRAVLNRSSRSTAARPPAPSVEDQIKKAGSFQDKMAVAFRAALSEAREQ